MTPEQKKIIYAILTSENITIDDKYLEILKIFPDYLINKEEKKAIYEKIEWIFHDGLWTYFEILVYNKVNQYYKLWLPMSSAEEVFRKMADWEDLYKKFFINNEYNVDHKREIWNIEIWAQKSLNFISAYTRGKKINNITWSSQDFRRGNARDLFIDLEDWEQLNFSLKTDKSWKIALFEWQTPDIYHKVYKRYFLLPEDEYAKIKQELFNTNREQDFYDDFQNIALLSQTVILRQLKLNDASINNLGKARIENRAILYHLIKKLRHYNSSDDQSIILLVNRLTWELGEKLIIDSIDLDALNLDDFSLTPCNPKKYRYGTEIGIKYKGKVFVSFQIKHARGAKSSLKFQDITIRLKTLK